MAIEPIAADGGLDLTRGSAVVCILALPGAEPGSSDTSVLTTAQSVLEHADSSTPVLIAGTVEGIERIAKELSVELRQRSVLSLALDSVSNEAHGVNAAARASFPSDFVLVVPGVRVTANWLARLQAAATSDSTVASATPLSLGPGALEIFGGDQVDGVDPSVSSDLDASSQLDRTRHMAAPIGKLAAMVSQHSLQLRPRVATVGPGCAYIRRAALELSGPLDEALSLERALADLAMRTIAAGMVHVAADDVLVEGCSTSRRARPDVEDSPSNSQVANTLVNDEQGRLSRAMGVARMALRRISVTIDGRALTSAVGGTQTYIIELIMALAQEQHIAVRVLVPPDLSKRAADALATLSDVDLLTYEEAISRPRRTNVAHRPQSVFTLDDLALLRLVGERVVIGQLDLIAYHNYSYHRDLDYWRAYRRATRLALGGADQVIFFSEHARRDALSEDLMPEGRTHVVSVGAEVLEPMRTPATPPDGLSEDDLFLLCLGADYAHKNRCFAMELLGALRELGWMGRLVLAGAHVPFGSSRQREHRLLGSRPDLAEFILDLGPVDEPSKKWLYQHARALVYPTLYEGFGLLPLEAARANLPCLFASQGSLSEVAGSAATLVPWNARASATSVLPLLLDGAARDRHLAILHALPIPAWSEVARRLVAVYEHAIAAPPSEAAPRIWQELDRETAAQEYQDAYHDLEERVANGLPLIDNGGLLNHAQQRGLMRVAARRRSGALLLAPLGLLGRRVTPHAGSDSQDATLE